LEGNSLPLVFSFKLFWKASDSSWFIFCLLDGGQRMKKGGDSSRCWSMAAANTCRNFIWCFTTPDKKVAGKGRNRVNAL
jgi:hypothetical protein